MPKLGMQPIRSEQICESAAEVIAEVGFERTTIRAVAEAADLSTGSINHWFSNRMDLLTRTLEYVSKRTQERIGASARSAPLGPDRIRAFLRASMPRDPEIVKTWRVWIAAWSAAVYSESLRQLIASRNEPWYRFVASIIHERDEPWEGEDWPTIGGLPTPWVFDAMLNGLVLQLLVGGTSLTIEETEESLFQLAKDIRSLSRSS